MSLETILKLDAPLYVDVTCYGCNRAVALSNSYESDGRRFCYRCWTGDVAYSAGSTHSVISGATADSKNFFSRATSSAS